MSMTTIIIAGMGVMFVTLAGGFVWMMSASKKPVDGQPTNDAVAQSNAEFRQGDVQRAEVTSDLLNFKDIKYGMIDLGNHQYRIVLECSSLNYHLKTPREQEVVHMSFKKFLDSLTFPISINIQTRSMDLTRRLESIQRDLSVVKDSFTHLGEYGDVFYKDMENLPNLIGNNKEKRKYIIIPYNDAATLKGLSDSEKLEDAKRNLDIRAAMIRDGLNSIGIKSKRLDTKELVELLYNSFNKNGNVDVAEALSSGEFTDMMVYGQHVGEDISYDAYVDWVLYDAQTRITTEVMTSQTPEFLKVQYQEILERLGELRDEVGAYYNEK